MSTSAGPNIVEDGLTLSIDPGSKFSYNSQENLYPHSESLSTLSNTRVTRTTYATDGPNGTGYHVMEINSATGAIYNFDGGNTVSLAVGDTVTLSAFVKNIENCPNIGLRFWSGSGRAWSSTRTAYFDLENETSISVSGTIEQTSIKNVGNGWYRLSITSTADVAGASALSTILEGNTGIGSKYAVSGVQLEINRGQKPSTYIPTDGVAIARDATIYNSVGTVSGTRINDAYFSTNNGGTFNLNGVDQYVDFGSINADSEISSSIIYSADVWFKMNQLPVGEYVNNSVVWGGDLGNHWVIMVYPEVNGKSNIGVCYDDSRYNNVHRTNKEIESGEWVNLVVMGIPFETTGKIKYYVNGELDKDYFIGVDSNGTGQPPFRIGYDNRFITYSDVAVGSIKHYNRVLTDAEIKQNFNALRGRYGI